MLNTRSEEGKDRRLSGKFSAKIVVFVSFFRHDLLEINGTISSLSCILTVVFFYSQVVELQSFSETLLTSWYFPLGPAF